MRTARRGLLLVAPALGLVTSAATPGGTRPLAGDVHGGRRPLSASRRDAAGAQAGAPPRAASDVSLPQVKVLIAPLDFRRGLAVAAGPAGPARVDELYRTLRTEMAALAAP